MPPKRKSDAAEKSEPRRSSRTAGSTTATEAAKVTEKPAKKTTSDTEESKDKENQKQARDKKSDEDESKDAPAAKKAKTGKINVGDHLTGISLKDDTDKSVSLLAESKDSGLVLFSYPAASTPGCTSQACSYRDRYEEITKRGFKVFGISTDTVNAQSKFKSKNSFNYPLLSDPKKELLNVLGGGTSAKKTALRCHWVFSAGGKLEAVEINVKPKDCVNKALASIDKIKTDQ